VAPAACHDDRRAGFLIEPPVEAVQQRGGRREAGGLGQHLGGLVRGRPVRRVLGQALVAQVGDLGRQPGHRRQRRRFQVAVRAQHLGCGGRLPRQAAGEHEVEQQAEGVHVGRRAHRAAAEPFRRQVRRGADHLAADPVGLTHGRGDAEVDELHAAGGDHHVARLDVAVHDVAGVGGGQRGGHLGADQRGGAPRQRAAVQDLGERPAVDQLHHHVRQAVLGLPVIVHLDHVRVPQPGGSAGLDPHPSGQPRVLGQVGSQHLDGDLTVEHVVVCAPDDRHAAGAEPGEQSVATCQNTIHGALPVARLPRVQNPPVRGQDAGAEVVLMDPTRCYRSVTPAS
jgi:hypothetical protein